ncbi:MAG: hypothetical protein ACI8S6_001005 [Myxococcota bacterium]|jgi:hypothetical protein
MLLLLLLTACDQPSDIGTVALTPDQEDRGEDGTLFTPNTQSFLRGHHWLDGVSMVELLSTQSGGRLVLANSGDHLTLENVALEQLVPRLHYAPASPPDAFDAMNLMLAEYSRNGLTLPYGEPGDTAPHFQTSLTTELPWSLSAPFQFEPAPRVRPLRMGIVNNCLAPGLWELTASDRAGELYHSWFTFPEGAYSALVAQTNGVSEDFAVEATQWRAEAVPAGLSRLRTIIEDLGVVPARLAPDGEIGFSSQSSRRKLAQAFVQVGAENPRQPITRQELISEPVQLVDFVPPGKYAQQQRRTFDLTFLSAPASATVRTVTPKTAYRWQTDPPPPQETTIEIELDLTTHRIVLGNLPLALLVPQEEFAIHGFGVGVLAASTPAERRLLLLSQGPAPSFAYLLDETGQQVLNSHDRGIEQVFIRAHVRGSTPYWEITVTSFERIVDLVRFHIEMPAALHEAARAAAGQYISPVYFTYRDDNLR